jgi:hypothetical protein
MVGLLIGVALLAAAGGGRPAPDEDQADALIKRGVQLRKSGDDVGALPVLEKAYQLSPTPRASAQLGLVEQALGRWDEAEQHLGMAIRSTGDDWIEEHRDALQKALGIIRGHVGSLQISGEPAGASVFVNGRRVGALPLREPVRVIAGDVDVELRADGYKRAAQKIAVQPYQHRPLVMRLERIDLAPARRPPPRLSRSSDAESAAGTVTVERTAPPPRVEPAESASPWTKVGVTAAGLGVGAATFGVVEALLGQSKMNSAVQTATRANASADAGLYMNASESYANGNSQRVLGRDLIAAGAVVAASGLLIALLAHGKARERGEP